MRLPALRRRSAGFSLVELTVVVVVLGVISTFAVPRLLHSVERSKAAESFHYLASLVVAQEAYNARNGRYSDDIDPLDVETREPEHFTVGAVTSTNWEQRWRCELTRAGASSSYGDYTVVFDETGFNRSRSTIPDELLPNF